MSKKANLKKLLIPLLWLGVGAAMGLLVARILGPEITDTIAAMGPLEFALAYGSLIALVALAAFLQIIIHEGGHLVFGLATGYRFSSFRVASLMLLKRDGRYELKHLSIAGTGGQCLMIPPAYTEEGFPYKLYNLGGVIANVVSALICGLLLIPFHNNRYVMAFLASIAVIGVGYALMNGIPFGSGTVPNDGWNALHMGENPLALKSFWTQLAINAEQAAGARLKDLPAEWFFVPTDEQLQNGMIASMAILSENRLMDMHDLKGARSLIAWLDDADSKLPELYRHLMINDLAYCDLLLDSTDADISELDDPTTKAILKQMKDFPPVLRTRHAVELLAHHDRAAADKVVARFEKVARRYPYESDLEGERELMAITEVAWEQRN